MGNVGLSNPDKAYSELGWTNWGDWLGTRSVASRLKKFLGFEKARTYSKNLKLKNVNEWRAYCKSGKLPPDIPAAPNQTYKNKGWISWPDWLGTDKSK